MTGGATELSRARLGELLARFSGLRVGVIGDLALDAYWYADMTRAVLSRETPHFPRPIVREVFSAGAGANVAHNLAELGAREVVVFSVLGQDWRAELLSAVLAEAGVNAAHLIRAAGRVTPAYIKPILQGYDSQQEDARLDFGSDEPLPPDLEDALIAALQAQLRSQLRSLDALLVADQFEVNGAITDRVRDALNTLAADHPDKVFVVDSRLRIGLFRHMILKPNRMEAAGAVDQDGAPLTHAALAAIGRALSARSERPAFITLSEEGVLVAAAGEERILPAAPVTPPLDPVGAGDAFSAALGMALAAGASPWEAGALANLAAAVVLEKLHQTGTASPAEILTRYDLTHPKDAP
ncbi:MAG: hypothetical protein JXN59_04985 [Anaerolineae bacterium]|nr:hypothetical protein [Anaerolineae bacterium]